MRKKIKDFEIETLQIMDESGNVDESDMPDLSGDDIKKMYELMILTRIFDQKALFLQRQGRLGTYAPVIGQEASQVGSAYAMEKKDWMFPAFRENGAYIARGFPMSMIYQYWQGDERGDKIPEELNDFTVSIPVSTQILHAVGAGWAAKIKGHKVVALVYFGDGATSEGNFHEGLNFAGVFKANVVFICQNNQYAISTRVEKQTASKTLAQKALAYGFDGMRVDGNDIFAVYKATKEALEKARSGKGPTLIECVTYRLGDHTTSDDASRYRTKEEVEEWKKKDPIDRLEKYMQKKKLWTPEYKQKIFDESTKKVEEAVKKAEEEPTPMIEDIFRYTFQEMPEELLEQMEDLKDYLKEKEGQK